MMPDKTPCTSDRHFHLSWHISPLSLELPAKTRLLFVTIIEAIRIRNARRNFLKTGMIKKLLLKTFSHNDADRAVVRNMAASNFRSRRRAGSGDPIRTIV